MRSAFTTARLSSAYCVVFHSLMAVSLSVSTNALKKGVPTTRERFVWTASLSSPLRQPKVPNFLFFGPDRTVDLSNTYGEIRYAQAKVRPLIPLLERYKFTVSENTPIEEEVALDPELLGHVFENLLAAYNPETDKTARKTTGSFYTPRVVVDFMVDEALIAYLQSRLRAAFDKPERAYEPYLHQLLRYTDEPHQFLPGGSPGVGGCH